MWHTRLALPEHTEYLSLDLPLGYSADRLLFLDESYTMFHGSHILYLIAIFKQILQRYYSKHTTGMNALNFVG